MGVQPKTDPPAPASAPEADGTTPGEDIQVKGYCARWRKQMLALLYKTGATRDPQPTGGIHHTFAVLLAVRNWPTFVMRLIVPALFVFLIWLINILVVAGLNIFNQARHTMHLQRTPYQKLPTQFDTVTDPEPYYINPIPSCNTSDFLMQPCYDFMYTPNNSAIVQQIVTAICNNNPGYVIPPSAIMGFANMNDSNAWLLANPLVSQGVFHFDLSNPQRIGYILQTNSTTQYFRGQFTQPTFAVQTPLQNAVEREISRYFFQQANRTMGPWQVALKLFAHPPYNRFNIVGQIAGPLIFAANMFAFVTLLSLIVLEKELGLRQALRTMGMLDSTYWLSITVFEGLMVLVVSLLISVMGLICNFALFRENAFVNYWGLFFTFGLAMTSFAMFLSVFLRRSASAVYTGFAIFIVGWITQTAVIFGYPFTPSNIGSIVPLTVIFLLMPWSTLVKGLQDLALATVSPQTGGIQAGQAFSYCKDQSAPTNGEVSGQYVQYDCVFSLGQGIIWLLILWVFYALLAVYLDNVLPNERGVRMPWYYCFSPNYWLGRGSATGLRRKKRTTVVKLPRGTQVLQRPKESAVLEQEATSVDPDVQEEEAKMQVMLEQLQEGSLEGHATLDRYAVAMFRLQRVFKQRRLCGLCGTKEFWAVAGAQFGVERGQLLCLLGPNGAGKTTTFNMLTGVIPPSGGDAMVYGEVLSSTGGMDRIRSQMGVCPQFDTLWEELTATEHMRIYSLVKGLRWNVAAKQGPELLSQVKLMEAANQMAGTYSGGMKRRLSVAIALLGDPKIVYLDEPTTGMDPISRRHVWDIIETAKKGRAIILTTHSMEEADILGDRIAIMARGRLRAIGTSIRLKQRFGSGYQISVAAEGGRREEDPEHAFAEIKDFFKSRLGIEYSDYTGAYMTFRVPPEREGELAGILKDLEANVEQLGINDLQMSLTSLEEVFLNIAKKAEIEAARAGGTAFEKLLLETGKEIKVPLGEEAVTDESTGQQYQIVWAQDEEGKLQILSHTPIVKRPSLSSDDVASGSARA